MSISISDLANALKPIMAAINSIKADTNVKLSEIQELAEKISIQLDTLGYSNVSIEQPVTRKKATKAETAKPAIVKRGSKAVSKAEEQSADESAEEPSEEEQPKRKSKAVPAKAPKRVTIMSAFKDKYKENPKFFDSYLTVDVKADIANEFPQLKTLTGDKLQALEIKAYYAFIKENYAELLNELKAEAV